MISTGKRFVRSKFVHTPLNEVVSSLPDVSIREESNGFA